MGDQRPYLVITVVERPSNRARTNKAGWADAPKAMDLFERPQMVDKLTRKVLSEASFIIDILQNKVVKDRYGKPEAEVINHFLEKYDGLVRQGMDVWMRKIAKK